MAGETEKVAELEGQVTNMEAMVADLQKKLEKATAGDDNDKAAQIVELSGQMEEMTKALTDATAVISALNADKEAMEKLAKAEAALTKEEIPWYERLKGKKKKAEDDEDEKEVEKAQKEIVKFLGLSADERLKVAKANTVADESVVIEGQTICKSAVGESTFNVMKAQAARIAKSEKDIADANDRALMADLKKRADEKYAHVPGSTEERAAMLKAIEAMEPEVKKSFLAVLEQSEKLAKAGFDTLGHGNGKGEKDTVTITKAARDFETKVAEIRKRDNSSRTVALAKARTEHPDLFKAYQGDQEAGTN